MNPQINMTPEEADEVFERFHTGITPFEEDQIKNLFPQYLFFRMAWDDQSPFDIQEGFRLCTCSSCGFEFDGIRVNGKYGKVHNERVTCPSCGRTLTGKAVRKHKYDMPSLARWIKTAIAWADGQGGILIEAGDAFRTFNHDCLTGDIRWVPLVRYYFAPGRIMMWENVDRYRGTPNWQRCKRVREPFQPSMGMNAYGGEYLILGIDTAISKSGLKYCQFDEFFEQAVHASDGAAFRYQIKYLAAAALYPQIEMAVKFGLYKPVWELVTEGKKNHAYLNWNALEPAGFLRMSKQDAKTFIQSELEFDDLEAWRTSGMALPQFIKTSNEIGRYNIQSIADCAEKCGETYENAVKYIQSQKPECWKALVTVGMIVQTWKDYLNMAKKLDYDLTVKSVRMPKDLQARHDAAAATIRVEEEKSTAERYRKRYAKLVKKYAYRSNGLMIVVPEGTKDIVREGTTLHHCVAGYAERHINGTVTILFLRHERRPERPFLTIEVYEDQMTGETRIRQIHGYKNERYGQKQGRQKQQEYAWFLNPWLEWVNKGSRRDRKQAQEVRKTG